MQADAEERRPLHTSEKAVSLSDRELEFVLLIAEQAAKLHVRPMSEHQDWQRRLLAAASTAASEFPISGPSDWVVACEALVSFFGLNPVSAFGCASDNKEARDWGWTANNRGGEWLVVDHQGRDLLRVIQRGVGGQHLAGLVAYFPRRVRDLIRELAVIRAGKDTASK